MVRSWHQQWQATISLPIASLAISMCFLSHDSRKPRSLTRTAIIHDQILLCPTSPS